MEEGKDESAVKEQPPTEAPQEGAPAQEAATDGAGGGAAETPASVPAAEQAEQISDKDKHLEEAFSKLIESQRKSAGAGGKKFMLGDLVQACCDKDSAAFPPEMISKAQRNAPGSIAELCACRPKLPDGRPCDDAQELVSWMAKQPFFQKSWLNEMVHQVRSDLPKPGSKTNIEDLLKMLWREAVAPEAPSKKGKAKKGGKRKRAAADVGDDGQGSGKAAKSEGAPAPAEGGDGAPAAEGASEGSA